jgi:hypothetical protein
MNLSALKPKRSSHVLAAAGGMVLFLMTMQSFSQTSHGEKLKSLKTGSEKKKNVEFNGIENSEWCRGKFDSYLNIFIFNNKAKK